jgi:hypothetical protein
VSAIPDTRLWRELRRRATDGGVLEITLRVASGCTLGRSDHYVVEVTWPGDEIETLHFVSARGLDAVASALADELRIPLDVVD